MTMKEIFCIALLALTLVSAIEVQENAPKTSGNPVPQLVPGADRPAGHAASNADAVRPQSVRLTVSKGAALQVALDEEVRIQKVGQTVSAQVIEGVYAFDRLVVPAGSRVRGEVTRIEPVSRGKRTLPGLDGDFTPARAIEIRFTDLVLTDGKNIPLRTSVTPGSG